VVNAQECVRRFRVNFTSLLCQHLTNGSNWGELRRGQCFRLEVLLMPVLTENRLSVTLFGPMLMAVSGRPVSLGLKGATLELLYFLIANYDTAVRREAICDRLWESKSLAKQRSALNSAVWRIGKKLVGQPGIRITSTDKYLCLNIDETVAFDARELGSLVRQVGGQTGSSIQTMDLLERALAATEAPLMDGIDSDWILTERERWSSIRIRGMTALMHWYGGNHNYEDAIRIGKKLLSEDPFRETVQIDVMWLHVLNGQRAQAIKQYEAFARVLKQELSIDPMAETQALYDHIRNERVTIGIDTVTGIARHINNTNIASGLAAIEQSRRAFYDVLRAQHHVSPSNS
jgi:DNA-binding SARP family transcriptional activator